MTTTVPKQSDADAAEPRVRRIAPAGARRRVVVVALTAAVLAGVAVWVVAFSSVLGVKTVRVDGAHIVAVADVRAAAGVPHGRPLLRLDTGAIARRVEQLPAVRSARVETSFPDTVVIHVTERTGVGYLKNGPRFVVVDADGVQFRTLRTRPPRLPLFAVPSGPQATASARAVAGVAAALGPRVLRQVTSIEAFDPGAITLVLADGRIVHWGSADRSSDKARILPTLLTQPGQQFDVSNPDQVVAR